MGSSICNDDDGYRLPDVPRKPEPVATDARTLAAIAAMQGLLPMQANFDSYAELTQRAVEVADALLAALREGKP